MLRPIIFVIISLCAICLHGQINVDQVVRVGRNALYFEDYVLSIQYFNQAIDAKPYLAKPYFYRALAKYYLDDMRGAEADATLAIERNPFIIDAYELRGVARQNLGKHSASVDDYKVVFDHMPVNKGILLNLAIAQEECGDTAAASSTFARLLKVAPTFDRAHLGLARLRLEMGDTTGAVSAVNEAICLNKYNAGGYVTRAEIYMQLNDSVSAALADMNEAIRLDPHTAGFFINRAFMRYKLDDYYGAMSDYDYALQLDPRNVVATYNRALLRMEVGDFDKAVDDLDQVIEMKGRDYRALYNRAVVNKARGQYKSALADADAVIEAFPDLAAAWFLRSDIRQASGDRRGAKDDYEKSLALARSKVVSRDAGDGTVRHPSSVSASSSSSDAQATGTSASSGSGNSDSQAKDPSSLLDLPEGEEQEVVAERFKSLLTVHTSNSSDTDISSDFGGPGRSHASIRGRVQDAGWYDAVELEPIFIATYYTRPTELKPSADYLREVDDVNRTRALRFLLQVTNHEAPLTDEADIQRHFQSVDYYTSYISTHAPRAIDYFARGMDFMTVRNYSSAIADFTKAVTLTPDFTLAWLMRSAAEVRASGAESQPSGDRSSMEVAAAQAEHVAALRRAIADLDKVIELSPSMAIAYFNKGVILTQLDDYTAAISAFAKAIELKGDMGEAFYNRGYCYFKLGNATAGSSDLSHAGELGIVGAYSLLKRMAVN